MMIGGSKDHRGSFELRSRTQDTIEGPISEAYIQHWFQEEFLRLFKKDLEFREQVLKCLLTADDDEDNVEMRKPRRTWFNGIGETQEVSCEEARYIHLCGETTCTGSDMSSEAADEKCHVVLKTNFTTYEQPSQGHLGEKRTAVSLEPVSEELFPSTTANKKDMDNNKSGILILGNAKVNYELPGAGVVTSSPLPSAVSSEGQHRHLEESSTGPCVHVEERGTQPWKANPLYLHSNSDTDSNDSWQHERSRVAWMDDLENGRMLKEVKMRKLKRLEEFHTSRKAGGSNNWRAHPKSVREICLSSNTHVLPHSIPEDGKVGQSERKKTSGKQGTGTLSFDNLVRASPSFICVMSEQTDDINGTSCPVKSSGEIHAIENVAPIDGRSSNLPFLNERKDQATCCVGLNSNEEGEFTSGSASAEHKRLHKDLLLKSPLIIVSQDLPFVFYQEDEKALLKRTLSGVRFPSGQICGTQQIVMNENGKPETLSECNSQAEERLTCAEEVICPVPNFLDKFDRSEGETESLASSWPAPLTKSDAQFVSLTERISFPPHCGLDAQSERMSPSGSILGSAKNLQENRFSQGQPSTLLSCRYEQEGGGEVTLSERNKSVEEETGSSNSFDEGERRTVGGSYQVLTCGSVTGREMFDPLITCEGVLSEKEVSSPRSPRISRAARLAAIDEEEQVVDAPKPVHDLCVSRPMARRATFKPAKDIHWLPPKRNIQFMGTHRTSAYFPLKNVKRNSIKWDVTCNRPQPKAAKQAPEEEMRGPWEEV
ncbi:unnamed protein product [Calypogeia fissa]